MINLPFSAGSTRPTSINDLGHASLIFGLSSRFISATMGMVDALCSQCKCSLNPTAAWQEFSLDTAGVHCSASTAWAHRFLQFWNPHVFMVLVPGLAGTAAKIKEEFRLKWCFLKSQTLRSWTSMSRAVEDVWLRHFLFLV